MASRCARKGTSLRAAKRWLADEMEIMEALAATHRVRPIDTVASKQKLRVLGEFFPSVGVDVRRDVLVAANYREDVAAAMLGDLTRESVAATTSLRMLEPTELLFVDLHGDDDAASELEDEEDWSEVATASNGTDAWVVIQDDWEVVDKDGEKVRTFADVLQTTTVLANATAATSPTPRPAMLSRLSIVEHSPEPSYISTLKKTESDPALPTYELERGVKSFGARKRRLLKHYR
ncbi:hypothetical protein JG687_00012786 [Phytophthora cactorum]|uniref:CUE domain-containing protein n=3 Tax=Phytophthora cactorum TaxID=29920 RepID=A0A8T1IV40_9STRA|nr:hypothetical protein Pcac1_g14685 [Phytophthora cactorum]KAG2807549.1 hypothetical protein PC111_g16891 [Phytophthora cactorum]KAG2842862.1 hypothetical protein PC112_g2828 [Phytophthora cactorum]KAG2866317.1 hypothetical protein PC113_g2937 [Phytophthora cactorum]KAG2928354.1 hypothetical protein PC114_g3147 [Phytophthora cactorum]